MRIEKEKARERMSAGGGSGESGRLKSDNPARQQTLRRNLRRVRQGTRPQKRLESADIQWSAKYLKEFIKI